MKRTWTVAVALALSFAVPAVAFACGNPITLRGSEAAKKVKRMEADLKAGKFSTLRYLEHRHHFADPRLQRRAEIVALTAQIRMYQAIETPDVEDHHLSRMRDFLAATPDNPLLQARLAEALVLDRGDGSAEEAKTIILDLAARDLITEADGWATLATVKARGGDTAGRDAALERCKKVAHKDRKRACRVLAP